jgi:hypothetical protein
MKADLTRHLKLRLVDTYYSEYLSQLLEIICETITEHKLGDFKALHKLKAKLKERNVYVWVDSYKADRLDFSWKPTLRGDSINWRCNRPEFLREIFGAANKEYSELATGTRGDLVPWFGQVEQKLVQVLEDREVKPEHVPLFIGNITKQLNKYVAELEHFASTHKGVK